MARWDPPPCYFESEVIYAHQVLNLELQRFFCKNTIFWGGGSCYHGNYFPDFSFSPCFKLGQNLSSCQVSEKSTHRFDQNDGTNIQICLYILVVIYLAVPGQFQHET